MSTVTTALLQQLCTELTALRRDHDALRREIAAEINTCRIVLDDGTGMQTTTIVPGSITLEHEPGRIASGSSVFLTAQAHHARVDCTAGADATAVLPIIGVAMLASHDVEPPRAAVTISRRS